MTYLPLGTDPSIFCPSEGDRPLSFPGGVFVGSTAHPNRLFDEIAGTTPGFKDDAAKVWEEYLPDLRQRLPDLVWRHLSKRAGRESASLRRDPLGLLWTRALIHQVGIKKRCACVSGLIAAGGAVFGDERWRKILAPNIYGGAAVYGAAVRELYCRSSFVLDVRQPQSRTGLTQRIFDAGACGAPVLAEWSPEIDLLFDGEIEIFSFDHLDGAQIMKEHILKDAQGARKKAIRTQEAVLSRHTYLHRAREILDTFRRS
jgi:spore maturation protein CgeB